MVELWDILDKNGNATGCFHERGKPMGDGEYHLTVYVFIQNDKGEYLISQRAPNKTLPNVWECTGGNAVLGDDSLTTALKEAYEELGIILEKQNGRMIKHHLNKCICKHCLADIWLFRQNIDISAVVLDPNETCGAMWASCDKINRMIDEKTFATWGLFNNINELFDGDYYNEQ